MGAVKSAVSKVTKRKYVYFFGDGKAEGRGNMRDL